LPGVGRKTANMVLGDAFGKPSIVVDTHVARLARRFGWTAQTDANKIERDVAALLPPWEWTAVSHRLIWHGSPGMSRPEARVPRVRGGPVVSVVRRGLVDEATARKLLKTGPFHDRSGTRDAGWHAGQRMHSPAWSGIGSAPVELAALMMRARASPANHRDVGCVPAPTSMPVPRNPHLGPGAGGGQCQHAARRRQPWGP
jgi:hypothetical protein